MSGVYIPNMKMPKSCSECTFRSSDGSGNFRIECDLLSEIDNIHDISENYSEWCNNLVHHLCPLVEVPPHGNLVGMDILKEKIASIARKELAADESWIQMLYVLDNTPTILEASK